MRIVNEAETFPVRIDERVFGNKEFQREGPAEAKDRDWAKAVLERGTRRSSRYEECSVWWYMKEFGQHITSVHSFIHSFWKFI